MTGTDESFGARLAAAPPEERYALHAAEGDREAFADYDRVVGGLFDRAIRGEAILELRPAARRTETDVVSLKISAGEREVLSCALAVEAQQARGAWYVPDAGGALAGMIEFAHWAGAEPRFAISAADAQRASMKLDTPDAILVWAALEPVMELLYLPLKLRSGYWVGNRRPELMEQDWATVDATYAALGVDATPLATFKDGRRWATLSIEEVIAARQALMAAWGAAPPDVGRRALVLLISRLVERYYAKAKNGMAQRTKVINKGLERALSGAFGGDWLAFVRYLGEPVHPAEQIATAVEPTSMIVSGRDRVESVAATTGVPAEEVKRMLAAYWGGQADSPIDHRVQVMRDWWSAFDELHARQAPGMPSLWGLLGVRYEDKGEMFEDGRYTHRGYELLPADLNDRIEQLWCTAVLPRWPNALVTEPYPQAAFAETLGAGIDFWQEVALTCWFICEGPYSRTDIPGMPEFYDRWIKKLEELGCPIDHRVFDDLREAEKKLTDRPPDPEDSRQHDLGNGITVSITTTIGASKKDGFEHLRDVVTRYRRAWADDHLDRYLQSRWEQDLRGVGDAYHRHVADKGKPPTTRQFAGLAKDVANRWFAGNLAQLSNALGLPSRDPPSYHRMMPRDRAAFVMRVRDLLGGARWNDLPVDMDRDERTRRYRLGQLADYAPLAVQVWEATGEPPPLKGTQWARFRVEAAFGEDTEVGWQTFIATVDQALREVGSPTVQEHVTELGRQPPSDGSDRGAHGTEQHGHGLRTLLSRFRG